MDAIGKMQTGHLVEDIDIVIDEVYGARGEYDSLDERLDDMSSGTPAPASSTPSMDGTGSAGTSNQYARADHVHPSDTSRASAAAEAEDRTALVELIDSGPKNTIDITPPTGTDSAGITYTPNADKSFTAQGTASALSQKRLFTISAEDAQKFNGMVLSGCPSGGSSSTYRIVFMRDGSPYTTYCADYGNGVIIQNVPAVACRVFLYIESGQTVDLTFKPMICSKAAWDISHEYQPYRPPYQELYERVVALEQANGITRSVQTMKSAAELPEKTEPEEEGEEVR